MRYAAVTVLVMFLLVACNSVNKINEKAQGEENPAKKAKESTVISQEEETPANEDQAVGTELAATEKRYAINPRTSTVEPVGNAPKEVVLLTIDDAPARYSVEMAKTLKRLGVKAIFFVNGHLLDSPEGENFLKEIHALGFPIGNHTYNHKRLTELTETQQREEIVSLNKRVESIIGERPKFFRPPYGENTQYSRQVAHEQNMIIMTWTYGYDWVKEYQNPEALADVMVNTPYLTNGANLLMHDRKWTSLALEDIVNGIKKKGFTIVDPEEIQTPANSTAS